ncbi:MAG: hypothetical protein HYV40_01260 [Candidatus Levybacteria bacterium]|nr:hypothetical protein [Candidatus Levybacteria bacterium]
MYKKGYYKQIHEDKIAADIRQGGFDPIQISNSVGYVYPKHQHPETKLLVFLWDQWMLLSLVRYIIVSLVTK